MEKKKTPAQVQAEMLCNTLRPEYQGLVLTLINAIGELQTKIEQQTPVYRKEGKLYQEVELGTGEVVKRPDPTMQEYRALIKDYATVLKNLSEIVSENKAPTQISDMAELKKKFKIAK